MAVQSRTLRDRTTSNTLDNPSYQHLRYVVCKSCHNTSSGEASNGKQEKREPTEALAQAIDE